MPLFFILFSLPCGATPTNKPYLKELIETSSELNLHTKRYWQVLLHYKESLGGMKSLVDDPRFFLSHDGKNNPREEIEATLYAFFKKFTDEKTHARCLFPARYEWLKKELNIDDSKLPTVACNDLNEIMSQVNPKSAVLVFPAAYMNSPASMFGHTLLRVDSDYNSKLLSYSLSYAATTNDTSGMAFAFKGIFGFYHGNYTILPYYDKVKEYNNMEQRDIWEYELNLTEEEVKKMFLHVWELKDVYSWYYFFDENCAYQLLFLLEAARPSLKLTDSFFYWIIPIDTVKVVNNNYLVKSVKYRPSIASKIKGLLNSLSPETQEAAFRRADGEGSPDEILKSALDKDSKISAIDLTTDIIQYKYSQGDFPKEKYKQQLLNNLLARSSLGKTSDTSENPDTNYMPPPPNKGHGSSRLSVGFGQREKLSFSEIKFRPSYQTLIDPDEGYHKGSQVVFFDLTARYYENIGLKLERLDVIDLFSLTPRNRFFKPLSWKVATGIRRKNMSDHKRHHSYFLNPGFGYTFENSIMGRYYMMVESDIDVSKNLDKDYAVSIGLSVGVLKNMTPVWKIHAFAKTATFEFGDEHREERLAISQNFLINRENSLSLDMIRERSFDLTEDEVNFNWNYYF